MALKNTEDIYSQINISEIDSYTLLDNRDTNGNTLLHYVCSDGRMDIIEKLISIDDFGKVLCAKNINGYTPIHFACMGGHTVLIKFFCENFPEYIHFKNNNDQTIFHVIFSCKNTHVITDFIEIIKEDMYLINEKDDDEESPLHYAAAYGYVDVVKKLVLCNININEPNHFGSTPLHIASARGFIDIVKELLIYGADVSIKDKIGSTFLNYLPTKEEKEILKFIDDRESLDVKYPSE